MCFYFYERSKNAMGFRRHFIFFFQAEDGIRDRNVTGVQTCASSDLNSPAISRTAARAFFLVFFQSDPPIFDRCGDSPPVYFDSMSSESIGTHSWSAGWPRLEGAYSSTMYSRREDSSPLWIVRSAIFKNLPIPCVSCTTKSPCFKAKGSTRLRRLAGRRLAPAISPTRLPVRSVSVTTTKGSASASVCFRTFGNTRPAWLSA